MASVWAILTATRRRIGKDNLSALAAGADAADTGSRPMDLPQQ